jgi:predicted thioredoxin/glutaredoxin
MNIELLEKALENDTNLSIVNTNIQTIKAKKNDILQQLGIKNRDNLKEYHSKLKNYRYIENIKELRDGGIIRWININKLDDIHLSRTAILCDIKILDKGIALVIRRFGNRYFTIYLNENLIFQYINDEENILLKAIDYLSK